MAQIDSTIRIPLQKELTMIFTDSIVTVYERQIVLLIFDKQEQQFFGPIETFCGGRTLMNFFADDLCEIPDTVEAAFDKAHEYRRAGWEAQLKNPQTRPIAAWIGGWRGTPDLLSPEMFERFSWKYMRDLGELCLSYGIIPLFHLDSDWTRGMKYFRELPKGQCILSLDGKTDIFKAKEIIGDYCCIMGDVPASLLSYGTPEEVDAYCKKLIKEVGSTGFILSSGCDAPYNAKLENLKAMAAFVFNMQNNGTWYGEKENIFKVYRIFKIFLRKMAKNVVKIIDLLYNSYGLYVQFVE